MEVYYSSTAAGVGKAVRDVMEALGWRDRLPPGGDVLLKVNLTWDYFRPGVDTGPWVLEAVSSVLSERFERIWVGESGQVLVDADRALEASGAGEVVRRRGLLWHNFSRNEWVGVERNGLSFGIPAICTRMPVVSIPVVKTHYRTVISVALKNLYGCLNDGRHNYHHRLSDYLTAVNECIPVAFTVADGTVSLEGDGPKPGSPLYTGFVAASADRVALDASISRVMGFDPGSIAIIRAAEGVVGTAEDLEDVCIPPLESPPRFRFTPARPNFVARVERLLRGGRSGGRSDGPLMKPLRICARHWYRIAYHLKGQRREALRFIGNLPCRGQWLGDPEDDG